MLSVYFENIVTRQRKRVHSLPLLKATGASLMDGDGQALATYNGGLWRIADDHFFVIGIETPVTIHFENGDHRSPVMGPYHPAWIIAGAVRAGPSQELALARLDEASGNWHLYADRTYWSSVVFSPHGGAMTFVRSRRVGLARPTLSAVGPAITIGTTGITGHRVW